MHDSLSMRRCQRFRNLDGRCQRLLERQCATLEPR
jgi:hypothetical protein